MPPVRQSPDAPKRIGLAEPDLRGREGEYLARCVADNWVSSAGPFVGDFEKKMAEVAGCSHGVAVVNGTAALSLALIAAGVKPGDGVIVPDYTFAATANSVLHIGAVPCFVDVTKDTWTLDPDLVASVLAKSRVAAVVPVHTLGHPAEMNRLRAICDAAGVALIEDAAGAIGAEYRGRPAGSLGDAAVFSFNGNKTVTAGGGGMIVTNRDKWAAHAKAISQQARAGSRYQYEAVGYNYRLTNVNAAIGLAQLERLSEMLGLKRAIATRYDEAFKTRNDLRPMPRAPWAESGCWLYSVLCGSREAADSLVTTMSGLNIEARHFWESLSSQPPYRNHPSLLSGVSESLSGHVVSLPCSSHLTTAEQERIIDALNVWRGKALDDAA
jgi:dTDP-4-amino-4,6-dideoxygalactose transaminase